MNPIRTALVATSALVASTSLSFANVVTQTASFTSTTNWGTSVQSTAFTPTHTVTFAGFDTSLGTLQSVLVTFTNTINGSITLSNNGTDATSVSGFLSNIGKAQLPSFLASLNGVSNTVSDAALAGGGTEGPINVSGTSTKQHTYTTGLSAFETSWTAFMGDFGSVSTSSGNGNGTATYTDTGTLSLLISYTYAPPVTTTTNTPEPASMAALGSGLIGLGVLRRRKKQ